MLALQDADPRQLGAYRVAGRLGQGGMGTVYLAEGPTGPVAIKVISPHLAADPDFVARFRGEVAAARRVRRFCTAPVLDAQLDVEPLWLVTEYVAGPDLARVLREHGPLTGSNLEALAVGVATALTAIHGAGIVHRDLKPANVLLSPLGPRVIDFGIARALDTESGRTATGRLIGTPDYMAPELVSGGTWSTASDVFAWGCVVFAAATGRSPFASKTVPEALYRVVHERPDLTGLDPALRESVATALAKDPAARPSAQELVGKLVGNGAEADTERVAGTIRLDLPGLAAPTPPPRPRRRRRSLIVASAAALLAAATVAGVLWTRPSGPPAIGDTLYFDSFDEKSWPTDQGSYRNAGRYDLIADLYDSRFVDAPINAVIPDRLLMETRYRLQGDPSTRSGLHCSFTDHGDGADYWYELSVRRDGHARIVKTSPTNSWNLTPDLRVPGFRGADVSLVSECVWEGDRVRLIMWVNGHEIARVVDGVPGRKGEHSVGMFVRRFGDVDAEASFEHFRVGRP
ncbi:serine/threonine-protein kinase [Nonomuraea sp. SYSU D8015]|uniref:serine/threonine-protein kinase n=1 Tax=Nonomuraea sp. SYSU D8015 TaxID=2593644 RepID=UPI001CB6C02E|nr:serine/threonine-protein kinase [Nonomuraea sp. SYSU D8015]